MSENNFYCDITNEEFFIYRHRTVIRNDKAVYLNAQGKELLNPSNNNPLKYIDKKINWDDGNMPSIITGNDKGGRQKRNKQLASRSKEHYKKEIADKRYQMNKDLVKKFKG